MKQTKLSRGCLVAVVVTPLLLVLAPLLLFAAAMGVVNLETPYRLLFGWIAYIGRMWGTIAFDRTIVIGAVLCMAGFAVGLHLLCRWLYRARGEPKQWRARWSGAMAGLILLMFVAGVCIFSVAHQALWLARSPVRLKRDSVSCSMNLKIIGGAIQGYCLDHNGRFPDALSDVLGPAEARDFVCPDSDDEPAEGPTTREVATQFGQPGHCSYLYIGRGLVEPVADAAHRVILYEQPANHQDGVNVLFADRHMEWLSVEQAQAALDRATTPRAAQEHGEVP